MKLGDVCEVINGLWTGKKEPFINICVIRNTNFTKDCKLNLDDVAYIDAEVKQFSTRKLQVGDIIVEKSGGSDKQPVGRVVLFDVGEGDYSFSNFTSALRVKGDIDPKYLHKCLVAHYRRGETEKLQSKTTGIRNLDMKGYLRLPIPIRPLPEQERIVAELDCLSDIIEKQKQQLKELDNLAQSIFYTTFGDPISNNFGWEIKPLGDVCESELGKTLDAKRNTGELYPYLCSINVQWGHFDLSVVKEMKMEPKELERYTVRKGDLLICEGGDTGRSAVWNRDEVIYYQNALHRLRFKANTMLPLFCQYLMLELKNKGEIAKYSKGQTIKHLVKSALLSIKAICPPFDLQQEFVSKIEAIEKQKDMIKQSIAETETLFNSRMDYYFN